MKIIAQILVILAVLATVSCAGACSIDQNQIENKGSSTTDNGNDVYTVSGSWANYYANIAELSQEADLIACGEIDRVIEVHENVVEETEQGDVIHYYTDFIFRISQTLKGDETEEAVIHQLGASGKMVVTDDPLFQQGEKYVLFLHKCESGVYFVLGGPQGRFKVVDDKVFSMDNILSDEVFISPNLDYNGIEIEAFLGIISTELE